MKWYKALRLEEHAEFDDVLWEEAPLFDIGVVADGSYDRRFVKSVQKPTVRRDANVKFDKVSLSQNEPPCFVQPTHCPNQCLQIDYLLLLCDMI